MNISVSHLISNASKVIGTKAVLKGIANQEIRCVILASDVDAIILDKVRKACEKNNIQVVEFHSKQALGKLCQIEVACACVGIINN